VHAHAVCEPEQLGNPWSAVKLVKTQSILGIFGKLGCRNRHLNVQSIIALQHVILLVALVSSVLEFDVRHDSNQRIGKKWGFPLYQCKAADLLLSGIIGDRVVGGFAIRHTVPCAHEIRSCSVYTVHAIVGQLRR
jgi:hypothetical protein